jgi:hypothetical protein
MGCVIESGFEPQGKPEEATVREDWVVYLDKIG